MTEIDPQFLEDIGAEVQRKIQNAMKLQELLNSEEPFDDSIYEDFDLHGRCGGNYDDDYQLGLDHGRQQFADEIKELLK